MGVEPQTITSEQTSQTVPAPRIGPLTVIVADDVTEIQVLLETWLQEAGCRVKCVSSGKEVTRFARAQHVDLIITDVIMPDGDGLDVILDMKRAQPKTRILAISGGGRHLQASECLKFAKGLGADEVLFKPFNRDQLLSAVTRALQVET